MQSNAPQWRRENIELRLNARRPSTPSGNYDKRELTAYRTMYGLLCKAILRKCSCRRDRHELLRAIADAPQGSRVTFLMHRKCRRDRHELMRAIADASQVARAPFLMRHRCRRDRHELLRAIADASQVARSTLPRGYSFVCGRHWVWSAIAFAFHFCNLC